MKEHEISLPNPVSCPKCKRGHLLALLSPQFKKESVYNRNPEFSHYEIYYRCSNPECDRVVIG